ncbi:MAG: hypothetical protein LC792_21615 [Actinobacteria bacterium]|nr:hypothetical protein [Actinomycetota bacterium]
MTAGRTLSFRRWWIVPALAVLMTVGVPLAGASSAGNGGRAATRAAAAEEPAVTDTTRLIERTVQLWNENKLDEMVAGHYTEDALLLPPNHEPIRAGPRSWRISNPSGPSPGNTTRATT